MSHVTLIDFERFAFLRRPNQPYPFAMFGIECGAGWYDLVYALCRHIEVYLETSCSKEFQEGFFVTQIKEKWGGLRFYTSYGDDYIYDLIHQYETKSFHTCELCGKPGARRPTVWVTTLCRKCFWPEVSYKGFADFPYRLKMLWSWLFD